MGWGWSGKTLAKPLSPGGLPSGAGGLPDSAHCCRCAPRWALPPGRETEGWYGLPPRNLDLLQLLLPSCSCHSSFPLWKCPLAAPSWSLLGGWALSIRFSECSGLVAEPGSASLTHIQYVVLSCAWGRGIREEPVPTSSPAILAFTTLTLLVEMARIVPIYRRKKTEVY